MPNKGLLGDDGPARDELAFRESVKGVLRLRVEGAKLFRPIVKQGASWSAGCADATKTRLHSKLICRTGAR